jgi:hypothetical protein
VRLERELQKLIEHNKKYMAPQPGGAENAEEEDECEQKPLKMKRIGGGFMPKE